MALKHKITKDEHAALDDALKALYVEAEDDEGQYVLQAEADPRVKDLQDRLNEFRKNNKSLSKQLADKGRPDPASASVAEQLHELREKVNGLTKERDDLRASANEKDFAAVLGTAGRKLGLNPDAVPDMVGRAQRAGWKYENGAAVAYDGNDNIVQSKRNPGVQMPLSEWLADQREDGAGFMFQRSTGAGGGSAGKGADGIKEGARVVIDPSPEFIQQNIAKISSGDIVIRDSA